MSCFKYQVKISTILLRATKILHGYPLCQEHYGVIQFTSKELRLLHMQRLLQAFNNDPDLATIPNSLIPSTMQAVYVCTGCDYVSIFHGLGKACFLNSLFEYSDFICSNTAEAPGTLAQQDSDLSVLSFFNFGLWGVLTLENTNQHSSPCIQHR